MKKGKIITIALAIITVFTLTFIIAGCGNENIVGFWVAQNDTIDRVSGTGFGDDGVTSIAFLDTRGISFNRGAVWGCAFSDYYGWTINGNQLTIRLDNRDRVEVFRFNIRGDELTLTDENGNTFIYVRTD